MAQQCHPHRYQSILRRSNSPAIHGGIPLAKLYDHLRAGVFLDDGTEKYSVDEESEKNSFTKYARAFSIYLSDDRSCWKWVTEKDEPSDKFQVEIAELLKVRRLDVRGRFEVSNLNPETTYKVAFVIKLKSSGNGWDQPVKFGVALPDGTKEERKVDLKKKPQDQWIEIKAGEVSISEGDEGEMEMFMFEHGGHWKSGLVFKGVRITPID